MSLCCGVICVLLESKGEQYGYVFQTGMIASVPLCIGLGWAYNDMSVGFEMFIFPLISIYICGMKLMKVMFNPINSLIQNFFD